MLYTARARLAAFNYHHSFGVFRCIHSTQHGCGATAIVLSISTTNVKSALWLFGAPLAEVAKARSRTTEVYSSSSSTRFSAGVPERHSHGWTGRRHGQDTGKRHFFLGAKSLENDSFSPGRVAPVVPQGMSDRAPPKGAVTETLFSQQERDAVALTIVGVDLGRQGENREWPALNRGLLAPETFQQPCWHLGA